MPVQPDNLHMDGKRMSVSTGMSIMKVMVDIEELRAKHDFVYKMLYCANAGPYREHYHAEIAIRLLSYLGLSVTMPANEIVLCVLKYTNVTPDTFQDREAYAYTGPADYNREALLVTWETFCAALLSNTRAGVVRKVDDRKLGQDALLFMHLAYNPPFMAWLRNSNPDAFPDDVPVLDPDQLLVFGTRIVTKSMHLFNHAALSLEDMVNHLRGEYPKIVGVYNPDLTAPETDFPDIPDDYELGVE